MTRINVLYTSELEPKILSGEFHEITRVFSLVRKAVQSGKTPKSYKFPELYQLGTGHVTFFYNKLDYISKRYYLLAIQLKLNAREAGKQSSVDIDKVNKIIDDAKADIPKCWWGNYQPTPEAKLINLARLAENK